MTITHPFHPWTGRSFELADRQRQWGYDQTYVVVGRDDHLVRVPVEWTSLGEADLFKEIGKGRAHFRPDDLRRLADLIAPRRRTRSITRRRRKRKTV